jgi:hypothetical protein
MEVNGIVKLKMGKSKSFVTVQFLHQMKTVGLIFTLQNDNKSHMSALIPQANKKKKEQDV